MCDMKDIDCASLSPGHPYKDFRALGTRLLPLMNDSTARVRRLGPVKGQFTPSYSQPTANPKCHLIGSAGKRLISHFI